MRRLLLHSLRSNEILRGGKLCSQASPLQRAALSMRSMLKQCAVWTTCPACKPAVLRNMLDGFDSATACSCQCMAPPCVTSNAMQCCVGQDQRLWPSFTSSPRHLLETVSLTAGEAKRSGRQAHAIFFFFCRPRQVQLQLVLLLQNSLPINMLYPVKQLHCNLQLVRMHMYTAWCPVQLQGHAGPTALLRPIARPSMGSLFARSAR